MRGLILWLLLTGLGFAQMDVQPGYVVSGLNGSKLVGDYIVVEKDSLPKLESVAVIKVRTEATNIIVKATNKDRNTIPVAKVDDTTYVVIGSGKLWVRCVCIDFAKNIYQDDEAVIELGAPAPEPVPPKPDVPTPTPDNVPSDAFDNIGQRVAQWTKGLPSNKEVGQVYQKYASLLKSSPAATVNDASSMLTGELVKVPQYQAYATFSSNVNEDLKRRWTNSPMSKGVLADYWLAIALGLGVK